MTRTVVVNGRLGSAEIRRVMEHWEIYVNGKFIASADWLTEAEQELKDFCEAPWIRRI